MARMRHADTQIAAPALPPPTLRLSQGQRDSLTFVDEVRLRFYTYNMGNSSNCVHVADLQGPSGRGGFGQLFDERFPDGAEADVVFASFVETRLSCGEWAQEYAKSHSGARMDTLLRQNARREGSRHTRIRVRGWIETMAGAYNGNLKSFLAFGGSRFEEDPRGLLFGRLTEARVAGVPVPNPKKAFMGRSLVSAKAQHLRLCFVSAHFPIARLASALEETGVDQLQLAKVAVAQNLRKVLKKAATRGIADERTAIFLQGDLNSRTVLRTESQMNEFVVKWDRTSGEPLGLALDHEFDGHSLLITGISGGVAEVWNRNHPDGPVNRGDCITEINGVRGRAQSLLEALEGKAVLVVKLVRTVADALMEVLRDDAMQAAIQAGLGLQPGRWLEIATYETAQDLPVTYKFVDHAPASSSAPIVSPEVPATTGGSLRNTLAGWTPRQMQSSPSNPSKASAPAGYPASEGAGIHSHQPSLLTIGDVIDAERAGRAGVQTVRASVPPERPAPRGVADDAVPRRKSETDAERPSGIAPPVATCASGTELYRRLLGNLGQDQLNQFGLLFKKSDFKAFRFPASADRLVVWAPDVVADRISFELPRGGYQVNLEQFGSDHRPFSLEVIMRVAQQGQRLRSSRTLNSRDAPSVHSLLEGSEDEEDYCDVQECLATCNGQSVHGDVEIVENEDEDGEDTEEAGSQSASKEGLRRNSDGSTAEKGASRGIIST